MKSCCFTGHRIIKITPELVQRLKYTILNVYEHDVTDFYNGGAIGWDQICAETVIQLKADITDLRLHMILPCPPEEQTKNWNPAQIAQYTHILKNADNVTVLSEHYTDNCMKQRNKRLVELSECCICYCSNPKSGTGQTLRMAKNKGIDIINLFSG